MADSELPYYDIDKVCRGCLGKKGEMRPLYGSCLDTMLMTVAEIQVHVGDGLPELMCVQCVLQVSRAFTFKQQCQRSDATLRLYCRNNYEEIILSEDEDTKSIMKNIPVEVQFQNPNDDGGKCVLLVQHTKTDGNVLATGSDGDLDSNRSTIQVSHEMPEKLLTGQDDHMELIEITQNDGIMTSEERTTVKIDEDYITFTNHSCNENENDDHDNGDFIVTLVDETNCSLFCTDCGLQFADIEQMHSHRQKMHSNGQQKPTEATNNIDDHNNDTNTDCEDCGIVYGLAKELQRHRLSGSPTTSATVLAVQYQCEVCQKCFGESKILRRHMKTHNPHKPHVCPTCNMSFAESSNLTKHKKKHTGELRNIVGKPNLCSACGKCFKWASSLSKHMKHHTKHKILNCPYCPKYYVEARSLSIHIRSHTGEKPYVCELCQKGFTQMGNLEKHMRVHTGEKPFVCPVCGKGFSQSGYVAIHIRTHTGERPYHCKECGKGFAGSNTLAIHKRTHTGERPYPCGICGKTFARQETAVIHQRTHTGEKPHVCTICHRGFTSSGHLTGHMRSHSGVKSHECQICRKCFAGSGSLKVHMRGHSTTEKVFVCSVCNVSYEDELALEEHELEHEFSAAVASPTIGSKNDGLLGDVIQLTEEIIESSELIISNEPLM